MAGEPTDIEVVREVLDGRVERFEILVRRYQRLVATAALRMGVPRQEVEDMTNEVFYKVYRSLNRYEPTHALSTWLYRITVNASLDRRRSRRHESRMDEIPAGLPDTRPSPHERAGESERALRLRKAVDRLPRRYRAPLLLAHVEAMSLDEVARVLDLPEGTVKSRLFRARAMLKEIILKDYPDLAAGSAGANS
jgi:RNA polymerase sigma factor (sigma-70 family)